MKKQIKKLANRTTQIIFNRRGEINYFLAIFIGAAILIVVAWPAIKPIVTSTFTTIATWFSTNLGKIFTNIS